MRRSLLATALGILTIAASAGTASAAARSAWASGQLEHVDAAARTIQVKQGTEALPFTLAANAHVMQGKKALPLADLAKDVGQHVKIRYTTTNGARTADRVEVTGAMKAPHSTAAKPAAQASHAAPAQGPSARTPVKH